MIDYHTKIDIGNVNNFYNTYGVLDSAISDSLRDRVAVNFFATIGSFDSAVSVRSRIRRELND